ncbi:MAG: PhzF family phenazine biosynthesis protein [Pyrinomonadaceae bacterium]
MTQRITQVDSFTGEPFKGNPAAVCVLPEAGDAPWMQLVAREMNLSETAFLNRRADGGYDLRWFTPTVEVDLCGHATLAAAHVLWEEGHLPAGEQARFHTQSGLLTAEQRGQWIELNFPARTQQPAQEDTPFDLKAILGVEPAYVGHATYDYIAELESEEAVRGLAPDFKAMKQTGLQGVIVTAKSSTPEFDFVSRYFAPGAGIDEDPVTGAAHCCLGPYWQSRLGQDSFTAFQASARGGVVRVRVAGDRVLLGGQAVTVLRGELL